MKRYKRLAALTCGALAASTVLALPAIAAQKPRIVKGRMVDRDGDAMADRVVLIYSKRIKHRADKDGRYPFKVQGYDIAKIARARDTRRLKIDLVESSDAPAAPRIRYRPSSRQPVTDMKGRQARRQSFTGVIPLDLGNVLTVVTDGPGSVLSVPPGIDCGSTCQASFDDGATVELTAVPDPTANGVFAGWGGDCISFAQTPVCVLTIDGPKSVIASFTDAATALPLDVDLLGLGTGSVVSLPAGIDCSALSALCTALFAPNTPVALSAVPDLGSLFGGWGGACSAAGLDSICVVVMDAAKQVTATFNPLL